MIVPEPLVLVLAGVFGAMIGSFLNVVIHRLPEKKSLVTPGSHCPKCEKPIRWFDNLPILSWLFLRGKCRACNAPISPRYMLVEALTAGLTVLVALKYLGRIGDAWSLSRCLASLLLLYPLVPVTFIDLKLRIIPDRITKPGMVVAVVVSLFVPDLHKPQMFSLMEMENERMASLLVSLLGVAAGAGSIWLMGVLGKAMFKKDAMGFGDVKFMGMVGGFLGPVGVLLTLLIACLVGSVIGITIWLVTRSHYLAFGPFLALGAALVMFFRAEVIHFVTVTYPGMFA